jgi:hypothetical protein
MSLRYPVSLLVFVMLWLSPGPPEGLAADRRCRAMRPNETVRVDFKATPLKDVVRFISCAVEINMVLEPSSLGGRSITVIAPRPVGADALVPLLRAALRHVGLIARSHGAYLVIQPEPAHLPSKRRSKSGR